MWRCFQPFSNCRKGVQTGRLPTLPRRRRRGDTMRGMPSGGRGGGEIGWPGGRGRRGGMQVALPAHWLLAGAHVGGRGGVGSLAAGQGVGGLWQPAAAPDVARLCAFAGLQAGRAVRHGSPGRWLAHPLVRCWSGGPLREWAAGADCVPGGRHCPVRLHSGGIVVDTTAWHSGLCGGRAVAGRHGWTRASAARPPSDGPSGFDDGGGGRPGGGPLATDRVESARTAADGPGCGLGAGRGSAATPLFQCASASGGTSLSGGGDRLPQGLA